ncbi:MAG: queuosine precursor transporter [Rhodobacteraceae bacterium]|nr:queuosine precursor transporter [Paracoccaceae bacterium]
MQTYGVFSMAIVVVVSNILVQHPIGKWLTWGAFTYPLSFLVSDIVNRLSDASSARRVVYVGVVVGLVCSCIGTQITGEFGPLVTLRVAIGSATAFLIGQLLDIGIFNRLFRLVAWWKAPFVSTFFGSTIDSVIFFSIAFSTGLIWIEPGNDVSWAAEQMSLLGFGPVVPFWVSLAVADWLVKLAVDVIALLPFRLIVYRFALRIA